MKSKLLVLFAAVGCFLSLAAQSKADIIIISPGGHTQTIPDPNIWGVVLVQPNGSSTFTVTPNPSAPLPTPKPSNTAN